MGAKLVLLRVMTMRGREEVGGCSISLGASCRGRGAGNSGGGFSGGKPGGEARCPGLDGVNIGALAWRSGVEGGFVNTL